MVTRTSSTGNEPTVQDGAAWSAEQSVGTGDHGIGTGGAYSEATPGCNITIVAPNAADVAVSAGVPARLFGIGGANGVVNGSAVVIKDGSTTIETFAATTLPVAGLDYKGAKMNTSLVVNVTVAAGTSVRVLWGPLLPNS